MDSARSHNLFNKMHEKLDFSAIRGTDESDENMASGTTSGVPTARDPLPGITEGGKWGLIGSNTGESFDNIAGETNYTTTVRTIKESEATVKD